MVWDTLPADTVDNTGRSCENVVTLPVGVYEITQHINGSGHYLNKVFTMRREHRAE